MFLRSRFLNTTAFFLSPPGEGEGDAAAGDDNNASGAGNGTGDAGGDQGGDNGAEGGEASGEGSEGQDDGGEGEGGGSDDDDDPFAGLTPEQRAKVERHVARETTWRDRQINKLHARRRSAEEDVDATRTVLERQNGQQQGNNQQQGLTQEDIRREAQKLRTQEDYDNGCNQADSNGRQYYGDKWNTATDRLKKMGGIDVSDMVNILATDNPAVVLYLLSQNPDEYDRIMGLPPARRNTEFVKLGMKSPPKKGAPVKEDKRPGDAPPPVQQVQGRRAAQVGQVNLYDDKVDDDAWYRARNEARRKKFSSVE